MTVLSDEKLEAVRERAEAGNTMYGDVYTLLDTIDSDRKRIEELERVLRKIACEKMGEMARLCIIGKVIDWKI